MKKRLDQLGKKRKPDLQETVKRYHRVYEVRGVDKWTLIWDILDGEFGSRIIDKYERCRKLKAI